VSNGLLQYASSVRLPLSNNVDKGEALLESGMCENVTAILDRGYVFISLEQTKAQIAENFLTDYVLIY
jgi:hypothetical protein